MRWLYSVAMEIVTWTLLAPIELVRIALGRSSIGELRERLGSIRSSAATPHRRLFVHAVSAGEMNAASALVHEMAGRGWTFVLSAGNEDARLIAERIASCHCEVERVLRFPWDRRDAMRKFLSAARPDVVAVIETELWPSLFGACRELGIPVVIAGARIERRAAFRYRLARPFFSQLLEGCSAILAINEEEAVRFTAIGAVRERVVVAGELKAEACLAIHAPPAASPRSGQVIVAGSTHPGEEEVILAAHERVCDEIPGVRLILAPRHVRRADAIRRRARRPEITVIDRIGELACLHRIADIVIVGGTFVPVGGHDLLDPGRSGRAIVIGPHIENIRGTAMAMRSADALCVTNAFELADVLLRLLRDEGKRQSLGDNARRYVESKQGVAKLTADRIEQIASKPVPSQSAIQNPKSRIQNQQGPVRNVDSQVGNTPPVQLRGRPRVVRAGAVGASRGVGQ